MYKYFYINENNIYNLYDYIRTVDSSKPRTDLSRKETRLMLKKTLKSDEIVVLICFKMKRVV